MAWRPTEYLKCGELDNFRPGKVTGWMEFAGMKDKVTFDLEGDFHRDIRGTKIRLTVDPTEIGPSADAEQYMQGFATHQRGKVGDMTAGLPPADYVTGYCYLEWYAEDNGRVVLELEQRQVDVIGEPMPARESYPISREKQQQNMAEFLGSLAAECNLPEQHAVCLTGSDVILADKRAANNKIRGMKLLTQDIRKKLPPLYSQDGKGGKAVVLLKCFSPSGSWTWYVVEGEPILDASGKEIDYQFFGLVDGQEMELGYFNLSELEGLRGPMGLPIERDLYWKPRTLEQIAPEMFQKEG